MTFSSGPPDRPIAYGVDGDSVRATPICDSKTLTWRAQSGCSPRYSPTTRRLEISAAEYAIEATRLGDRELRISPPPAGKGIGVAMIDANG
jgi:hypothetical protein